MTPSMPWITPLDASMSGMTTLFPATRTSPSVVLSILMVCPSRVGTSAGSSMARTSAAVYLPAKGKREKSCCQNQKSQKKVLGGFNWKGVADGSYRGRTFDHVVREDFLEVGVGEDLVDGEPGGREEVGERLVDGREQGEGALGGEVVGGAALAAVTSATRVENSGSA